MQERELRIDDYWKIEDDKWKLIEEAIKQKRKEFNAVTDNIEEILDAIRNVSIYELIEPYITEDMGDGHCWFDPPYRDESGTICFVINEHMFHDLAWGQSGDVLQFVALEMGLISSLEEYPTGEDWWRCVDELRWKGFEIPQYLPNYIKIEIKELDNVDAFLTKRG